MTPIYRTESGRRAIERRYREMPRRWPVPSEQLTIPTREGDTLGGRLALDYAIRRPEAVERLVLLCPGGVGRQKMGVPLAALLLMPLGRWGLRTTMRMVLGVAPQEGEFSDYFLLIQKHFRYRRDPLPVFSDEALGRLTVPLLAILGGRDSMLDSFGTQRRLAQAVPHADIRLLPGAGHLLTGQSNVVLEFLRDSTLPKST